MQTKQKIINIIWDAITDLRPVITKRVYEALIERGCLTIAPLTEEDIDAICEAEGDD